MLGMPRLARNPDVQSSALEEARGLATENICKALTLEMEQRGSAPSPGRDQVRLGRTSCWARSLAARSAALGTGGSTARPASAYAAIKIKRGGLSAAHSCSRSPRPSQSTWPPRPSASTHQPACRERHSQLVPVSQHRPDSPLQRIPALVAHIAADHVPPAAPSGLRERTRGISVRDRDGAPIALEDGTGRVQRQRLVARGLAPAGVPPAGVVERAWEVGLGWHDHVDALAEGVRHLERVRVGEVGGDDERVALRVALRDGVELVVAPVVLGAALRVEVALRLVVRERGGDERAARAHARGLGVGLDVGLGEGVDVGGGVARGAVAAEAEGRCAAGARGGGGIGVLRAGSGRGARALVVVVLGLAVGDGAAALLVVGAAAAEAEAGEAAHHGAEGHAAEGA